MIPKHCQKKNQAQGYVVEQENMFVEKTSSQKLKDYEEIRNPN